MSFFTDKDDGVSQKLEQATFFKYKSPDDRLHDIQRAISRLSKTQDSDELYDSVEIHAHLAELHEGIAEKIDTIVKKRVPLDFYEDTDFPHGESRLIRDGFGQSEVKEFLACADLMSVRGWTTTAEPLSLSRFLNTQLVMSKPDLSYAQAFAAWRPDAVSRMIALTFEFDDVTQKGKRKRRLDFAGFNRCIARLHRIMIESLGQRNRLFSQVLTPVSCKMRTIGAFFISFYVKD